MVRKTYFGISGVPSVAPGLKVSGRSPASGGRRVPEERGDLAPVGAEVVDHRLHKLQAQIPKSLQILAGVPIVLHELTLSGGRGDWLATTSCPSDERWRYHAEGLLTTGETIVRDDSVPCR